MSELIREQAREELILAQSGLVYLLARKISERRNRRDLLPDLSSAGTEALMKAVDSFDPDRAEGASLFTYAYRKILGAMTDYLREERYGGVHVVRNDRETAYKNLGIRSLDEPALDEGGTRDPPFIGPSPVDKLLLAETLRRALTKLKGVERQVFLSKKLEELTYEEISVRTGIKSIDTLKSHLKRAIEKLGKDPSLIELWNGGHENE